MYIYQGLNNFFTRQGTNFLEHENITNIITKITWYIYFASNKNKRRWINVFKKFVVTTALATTLLFSGVNHQFADASANDSSQNVTYQTKAYYSMNGGEWQNLSTNKIDGMLSKWLCENPQQQKDVANKQEPNESANKENQEKLKQEANKEEQQDQKDKQHAQEGAADQNQTAKQDESMNKKEQQSDDQQLSQFEQEVVELTNEERAKQGLSPLKADAQLSKVARDKSKDMATNGYFSHNSPTYGSPFDMMKQYGITYRTAGENIAKGQRTPQEVVNGWMNSEGHRANIMNGEFTHIGVGYVEQGNHWTQQFIGK